MRFVCRTRSCGVRLNIRPGCEPEFGSSGSTHDGHDDLKTIEWLRTRADAIETGKQVNPVTGKRPALSEAYELAVERTKSRVEERGFDSVEAAAMVPELLTVRTAIQRGRAKRFPQNPLSRGRCVIEESFTRTHSNAVFLQTSNMLASDDRMLLFASDDFLTKLAYVQEIWVDGTFYACPALFEQLYTIHAYVNGQMYCLAYALLQGFSERVYKDLLRFLQDRVYALGQETGVNLAFAPKRVTCDFEAAAIAAFRSVFAGVEISGCWFHQVGWFCQCLWRNLQKKNLQQRYVKTDPVEHELRRLFKRLCALSLIPLAEVPAMHLTIVQEAMEHYATDDDVNAFLTYFESTWMSRTRDWNHYGNFGVRTTNHLEAFHGSLKRDLCGNAHPTLYPFIDLIRKRQSMYEKKMQRMTLGSRPEPLKSVYKDANRKYILACQAYENSPFPDRLHHLMSAVQNLIPDLRTASNPLSSN